MFETGRRSATSTSELGLYSDRSDHYHRNRYGIGVRKYVIGVMVVLGIILVSFLLYDFTSGAMVTSHGAKETKHIYILQNALKRPISISKRTTTTTLSPSYLDGNKTELIKMEDRSDGNYDGEEILDSAEGIEDQIASESRLTTGPRTDLESRSQNLNNFNLRKRLLSMDEDESEEKVRGKQLFDNHAMVYRLRQRYKHPVSEEEDNDNFEESRPIPFHFGYRTPVPTSFKRPKFPQLAQYRYPHSSNNIQDIIKYLTRDNEKPTRGIKFSGVYVNPKKFDFYPEVGEMMSNSDRSEEDHSPPFTYSYNSDPFYQYKPKHPSDINLLATSNVRFSPSGTHRYNPSFYDPYFQRPSINFNAQSSASSSESQYDNYESHGTASFGKKRKAKPLSVMLDIYPISDGVDPNRKSSRPRTGPGGYPNQLSAEESDTRRPVSHSKGLKYPQFVPPSQPISLVAIPSQQTNVGDEERQQMVFHLNLYPKRRSNKLIRNDFSPRSQRTDHGIEEYPDEKNKPPVFDKIAKQVTDHSAIQVSKFEETRSSETTETSAELYEDPGLTRYEESELQSTKNEGQSATTLDENVVERIKSKQDKLENSTSIPWNHRPLDFTLEKITKKLLNVKNEKPETVSKDVCDGCKNSKATEKRTEIEETEKHVKTKDIDTVEGFEDFADGLLATD
ncbi:uncharacterized protein LOC105689530 [Athalia rosae]|uniref:uncharacterized protein LOC105689530 n=1 Tax=Athalia rosae TaxID=37344 RepID=UPI0020338B9C|nr:uncharacterized protein LOC105689530 [Athalia rosae]